MQSDVGAWPKCPRCGTGDDLIMGRKEGFERIMVFLTGKRKYRCPRCSGSFRAPDHRVSQKGTSRETQA